MNVSKILATVLATFAISSPVLAGSFNDSKELIILIESTGTQVSVNSNVYDESCHGKYGYYSYEKDVNDILVVCSDQVDVNDPHELWETLAHEGAHVMQACLGSSLFNVEYTPRIFRTLSTKAPHYAKMIDTQYSGHHAIMESEAFYMELQSPTLVKQLFAKACLNE